VKKIFISTSTFAQFSSRPLEILNNNGYDVEFNNLGRKLNKSEVLAAVPEYDAIIAGTELYNAKILDLGKSLKVISRVGVGLENIDLEYANQKGIKVFKTQTTPALSVAELVLGLMLNLLRKISGHNQDLKSGIWKKQMGSLLNGKTLGVIGLGTIGKKLVEISKGMQLKYLAYDVIHDEKFAQEHGVRYCDLVELLTGSDVVSVHLSMSGKTKGLIGFDQLKKMKNSSILINTSRGDIINEQDLEKAIRENIIAGAGLDVFKEEPYKGTLTKYDNVIVTPHVGSYAKEIRVTMELEAVQNLLKGLKES